MYNAHRPGIGPGPNPPNNRLAELLDQVRQEFDNQAGRAGDYEQQRKFAQTMQQMLYLPIAHNWCTWTIAASPNAT
jgi:glucose repression regulatory protein TUP1